MYACMTPVGFDTFDKFENHWSSLFCYRNMSACGNGNNALIKWGGKR